MLYRLYSLVDKGNIKLYFTAYPELDNKYWGARGEKITWFSDPLPFGKLYSLSKMFSERIISNNSFFKNLKGWLGLDKNNLQDSAKAIFGNITIPNITGELSLPSSEDLATVFEIIKGRMLLEAEIIRALKEYDAKFFSDLKHILHILYLNGKIELFPGITSYSDDYRCFRCGEERAIIKVSCGSCNDTSCGYCETCVGMGQVSVCRVLYAAKGNISESNRKVSLRLDFSLTKPQQDAFNTASDFIYSDKRVGVIWAACGAGKTEVSFGAIKEELKRGGKVLYAIPRKDTVMELEPRIRDAFPDTQITALYGGSPSKYQQGDIVVATTHQCLRFYRNFSLIILDEADAFPYEGSEMLYLAVERARTDIGKILYMTATPTTQMLAWSKEKDVLKITVPARHHGYPLPEPRFIIEKELKYSNRLQKVSLPQSLAKIIHESVEVDKAQVFVFVPTVALAEPIALALKEILKEKPNIIISYSHAKDSEREQKRENFCQGRIDVLVTTSIMERGITVKRANVLVLFADFSRIFSWRALLQMAGRAGRKQEYPEGKVWFVADKKSEDMQETLKITQQMNKEAKEKGYLKV